VGKSLFDFKPVRARLERKRLRERFSFVAGSTSRTGRKHSFACVLSSNSAPVALLGQPTLLRVGQKSLTGFHASYANFLFLYGVLFPVGRSASSCEMATCFQKVQPANMHFLPLIFRYLGLCRLFLRIDSVKVMPKLKCALVGNTTIAFS